MPGNIPPLTDRVPGVGRTRNNALPIIYLLLTVLWGYAAVFRGYEYPPALFWDENYHIASAMKYLHGVFFLEPHPPLGKIFIALGEWLLQPNVGIDLSSMLNTDYIKQVPAGFSFRGVRFFPALFGWWSVPLFFIALLRLFRGTHLAFVCTLLFALDNGMILQSRGAMLDSAQIFFLLLALLFFLWGATAKRPATTLQYAAVGVAIGCSSAVKVSSILLVLVLPWLLWQDRRRSGDLPLTKWMRIAAVRSSVLLLAVAGIVVLFYALHFSLATRILEGRSYQVSSAAQEIVVAGESGNLKHLPLLLREVWAFSNRYQEHVPRLDVCKPGENGSHPLLWLLGGKTINYRWERTDNGAVRYLYYLQNPLVTAAGLLAVIAASVLLGARVLYGLRPADDERFSLIALFWFLYVSYIGTMVSVSRVMYLYHYLIPLIFALCLVPLVIGEIFAAELARRNLVVRFALVLFMLEVVACFVYFSPLTYYQPLTPYEVSQRAWFAFWQLRAV